MSKNQRPRANLNDIIEFLVIANPDQTIGQFMKFLQGLRDCVTPFRPYDVCEKCPCFEMYEKLRGGS